MFRLISILLLLGGLGALAFGGMRMMQSAQTYDMPAPPEIADAVLPELSTRRGDKATTGKAGGMTLEGDERVSVASVDADPLAALQTVPIAHETPDAAKFGRAFDVTVAIDATGDDTAADVLPQRGTVVEGTAQVSAKVQAALSGQMFKIEAVTPMVQTVSPLTENVFRWRVTPLETGSHDLAIELFALNDDGAMPVRTFRDRVEVQVSRVGQIMAFASSISPLVMIIGGLGSLIGGLFGAARFFRRT